MAIAWADSAFENLGAPSASISLLQRVIAAAPHQAMPYAKLGNVYFDQFDFAKAVPAFETALRLDPEFAAARIRLARAFNVLHRYDACLALLDAQQLPGDPSGVREIRVQRGIALEALHRIDEAEAEYRAALAADPKHRHACMRLARLLRRAGRRQELLSLCEGLAAAGVRHAQLLLDWGRALALNGDVTRARRLLLDRSRAVSQALAPPAPFASAGEFDAAFAEELLTNPFAIGDFPEEEEANRGSRRVHHLVSGKRPELVRSLLAAIQRRVDAYADAPPELSGGPGFDPWREGKPSRGRLHAWGLIQRHGEYEAWHTHRGGWLSGVYYVRIPAGISEAGEGRGCIEFGLPPSLAETGFGGIETLRIAPREGMLILAPSHYHHRTIPSGLDEYRISFAFDVVPVDAAPDDRADLADPRSKPSAAATHPTAP